MHAFELISVNGALKVKATGSTRAGLIEGALQGQYALLAPKLVDPDAEPIERPFKRQAADFPTLLADLLDEALSVGSAKREAYEFLRFTLITADRAEGAFVGRAVESYDEEFSRVVREGLTIDRNAEGQWETTLSYAS